MYSLAGLVLLETLLEGFVCAEGHRLAALPRKLTALVVMLLLAGSMVTLCVLDWHIWAWAVPVVGYRLLNVARVYQKRLPAEQLRTVALRAFGWLLIAQVAITALAWVAGHYGLQMQVFNVLVGLQLLAAIVLLRATLHTWRHAGAPNDRTSTMTDRELPTVSVLVPARNETKDLQRCLEKLVASNYPKLEIVVYDDCSATRRTPDIIRSFAHNGIRFIQGDAPDESRWLAKNYAYDRLASEASGDVLIFCGVDARMEPGSIRQLVFLLEQRGKDMLSVMPLGVGQSALSGSVLQAMRYFWEIGLPRRFFKRPPVISTCWLIRRTALKQMGGLASVSRSVNPEAPLARRAVITDSYAFIRSDSAMGIYSDKRAESQYDTSVRVRYPQLHRRLELVALVAMFDTVLLLGPFIGLLLVRFVPHTTAYVLVWAVCLMCLCTVYGLVAGGVRLASTWVGWLMAPIAFAVDLLVLHISLWKYEFSAVNWKGRNVCIPVMRIEPSLSKLPPQ